MIKHKKNFRVLRVLSYGARRLICLTGVFLLLGVFICSASDKADIYFNAGTEKYLQGDYISAIENLEKAQAEDPGNGRITEFMVKILSEAATQQQLKRDYKKAMEYLEKAKALSPLDPSINEMYDLNRDILSKNKPASGPVEKLAVSAGREEAPVSRAQPLKQIEPRTSRLPEKVQETKKYQEKTIPKAALIEPENGKSRTKQATAAGAGTYVISVLIAAAVFLFLRVVFLTRGVQKLIKRMELLKTEKNEYFVELEKNRERVKYEHNLVESLSKDLGESRNREGKAQAKLEQKNMELLSQQDRIRMKPQDVFSKQQQAKVMEYLGDTTLKSEENSSPALESARDRIALMSQNLFDYSPRAALDFLRQTLGSPNALMRANVAKALVQIARPETIDMLCELYLDKDLRVKREALKNLKEMVARIEAGSINVDDSLLQKIRGILDDERSRGEWVF
jgi:hypothetical protein